VGAVTLHQITRYSWTLPPPSAYQTRIPLWSVPRT
jgi:hypothetical protein